MIIHIVATYKNKKGGLFGDIEKIQFFLKNFRKKQQMRISKQSHSAENSLGFLKLQFAAKYQKTRGGTLWRQVNFEKKISKKNRKKRKMRILKQSHSAEKLERGDPLGFLKLQFAAKYQKI